MKVTEFARLICKREGKKKQVDIAQVLEILKIERAMLKKLIGVDLYILIHAI